MTFPTPFTVGWHRFSDGTPNARNAKTAVYTPALDAEGEQVAVMGWAATVQSEPSEGRVVSELDLYVPPSVAANPRDVVDVPGEGRFGVVAHPEDFTKGPFGFVPGKVVKLRRVQSS